VATSDDVDGAVRLARARFSRLVTRVLDDARDQRDLTDREIAKITGVGTSTFHRWKRGDWKRAPELRSVRAFFGGLGVPVEPALIALGVTVGRDDPEPEPTIDLDVRRILRMLADPNVPDERKIIIRGMLRMIAREARATSREISA
jgi:transcriptional regulator with XRE-family HTH domain